MNRHAFTAAEDQLSSDLLGMLVDEADIEVSSPIVTGGYGKLRGKMRSFFYLAPNIPVVILTDLDSRACSYEVVQEWKGYRQQHENLLIRVAVRQVESWILSDRGALSQYAKIPENKIPRDPEELRDPKEKLLNLLNAHAPRIWRDEVVVFRDGALRQGLGYNNRLSEFVKDYWRVSNATVNSQSLARAHKRIQELGERL